MMIITVRLGLRPIILLGRDSHGKVERPSLGQPVAPTRAAPRSAHGEGLCPRFFQLPVSRLEFLKYGGKLRAVPWPGPYALATSRDAKISNVAAGTPGRVDSYRGIIFCKLSIPRRPSLAGNLGPHHGADSMNGSAGSRRQGRRCARRTAALKGPLGKLRRRTHSGDAITWLFSPRSLLADWGENRPKPTVAPHTGSRYY